MEKNNLEEISLGQLKEVVLKYKVLILGIVGVSLLFSLIYSFIIAEPLFRAKAQVEILSINTGVSSFDRENEPKVNTDTYIEWFKDMQFLSKVTKRLQSENINIDASTLRDVVSAVKGKDGKSISISAEYRGSKEAARIVNIIAVMLSEEASIYLREQIQKQILINAEQLSLGRSSYERALSEYKEYATAPESLSKLQSELDICKSLIIQLKANLISGNIGSGKSNQQLEKDIELIEEKIIVLQDKLVDATYLDISLKRELNSSLVNYESLSEVNDKLELSNAFYAANSNIDMLSPAIEPNRASSPNRKVIIVVSLITSICFGIFVAFTFEYLKNVKRVKI